MKETGERFKNNQGSGYANSKHGTRFDFIAGPTITGPNYKPSACRCIPWEACACGRA